MRLLTAIALCIAPLHGVHAAEDKFRLVRETEALTPEQERAALKVPDGFEVQLFAAEPQINKPINIAFDARGRLWVSSTVEYPYAAAKERWSDPQGTRVKDSRDAIKILEDTDGDGRADKVTTFANGLNIPTGVLPWHKPEHKDGCIAFSIPNIWYFADTDGDGRADLREILFGPLGYEKDTHGMCSSFRLGLDGWVYATHGFSNTSHFKAKDGSTLDLQSGNVFRFRPDGSRVELYTSGQVNPFGLCWDRYGNLYSADCHSNPITQLIRGACYPSFGKPHDGLGFAPNMCAHSHGSTGICGIIYIDGGVWGPEWDDHMLVGNCVTSKVNHDKITFTGSTPKANEQPDFITSADPWFRPVDLQLGPDNALYIADFYNKIIGHYEVPLDHPGRDRERGRIWRVVPKGKAVSGNVAGDAIGNLGNNNSTRRHLAVQHLTNQPRLEAGRLALLPLDRSSNDATKANALWALLARSTDKAPHQSIKSLAALADSDQERNALMVALLRMVEASDDWFFIDDEEFAHCFSSSLEGISGSKVRKQALAMLAADPRKEPYMVTQLLGPLDPHWATFDDTADTSLIHTSKLAIRALLSLPGGLTAAHASSSGIDSQWFMWNVALSVPTNDAARFVLDGLLTEGFSSKINAESRASALKHIARNGSPEMIQEAVKALQAVAKDNALAQTTALEALHNGLLERGSPATKELLEWARVLAEQMLDAGEKKREPAWETVAQSAPQPVWTVALRKCADGGEAQVLQSMKQGGGDEERRTGALRSKPFAAPAKLSLWLCGHRGTPKSKAHDKSLVRVVDAQSSAVLASAFPPRSDVCQRVEFDLAAHTGEQARIEIVDGDAGAAYAWLGITRIEPAVVSVDDFTGADGHRAALQKLAVILQHTAPAALRDRLAPYLPPRPAPPPLPVSPEMRRQLDTLIAARTAAFAKAKPDAAKGKQIFTASCAVCHQLKGEGGLIGPQLDGIGARGAERLCEDILDPNRNVDAHFHIHTLKRKSGDTLTAFHRGDAGAVSIFVDAAGAEHRVPKSDITEDAVTPMSLMPPTFGQMLAEKDFQDLLAFLLRP